VKISVSQGASQGASQGRSFLARAFDLARPGVAPPLIHRSRARDDNVQEILGTIGPVGKMEVYVNPSAYH